MLFVYITSMTHNEIQYDRILLYYFTGTGNALRAGRWIQADAVRAGIPCDIIAIDRNKKAKLTVEKRILIGFLYPTHGFNMAPAMMYFIFHFPRRKMSYASIFLINTRAGAKVGSWLTPGLSGMAQLLPMFLLYLKGYTILGGLPLDMPSNWISIHPGFSDHTIQFISAKCKIRARNFFQNILAGKKQFGAVFLQLPIDLAILPITLLYFFIGRFLLAKTFIYTPTCNGCGVCWENCPVGAIKNIKNHPYWTYHCESCMRCLCNCPKKSIQASHLLFFLFAGLSLIPLTSYITKKWGLPPFFSNPWIEYIFDSYMWLGIFFIIYGICQPFFKKKVIGNLFRFTSLTNYWRRYRATGITPRDLKVK